MHIQEFPPEYEYEHEEISPSKINIGVRSVRKTFQLRSYLRASDEQPETKLPGSILKVYKNTSNIYGASPFFLIKKDGSQNQISLYTIEPNKQELKSYDLTDLNEETSLILLNCSTKQENVLLISHNKTDIKQ